MNNANMYGMMAGQTLRPGRQQDLPLPERQDRITLPPAQEPPSDRMDDALSEAA